MEAGPHSSVHRFNKNSYWRFIGKRFSHFPCKKGPDGPGLLPCRQPAYSASILEDFTTWAQFAYSVLTMAPSCCGFM